MAKLRAGAASADITPPGGGMMDGYGNRQIPSLGVHDPLLARALVLDYGEVSAALIGCDLLAVHPWITAEVRRRSSETFGIAEDALVLAATHNHAGPAGLRAGMFSRLDEALAEATVAGIVGALEQAWAARQPVTIKTGVTTVETIGMNRRDPDGPADAILRAALFDGGDGPVVCLLNFACHATVLSGENLLLSGEFPAAACRIVEDATGAGAVYLNGACGDVNPMWMRQDFASVERAGFAVGGAAVALIAELRAVGQGLRAHNIRWDEFPEHAVPGRVIEPHLCMARRQIDLPLREFKPDDEYAALIAQAETDRDQRPPLDHGTKRGDGDGPRRTAMAQLSRLSAERWSAAWARRTGESGTRTVELQALSLGGGLALLALPGEFFAETGAMIREAAGIEQLLIACYANDYAGYIVPEQAYDEGGYESGVTFFAPGAEAIIRKASLELLSEVCRDGD